MEKIQDTHRRFSFSNLKLISFSLIFLSILFTVIKYHILPDEAYFKTFSLGLSAFSTLTYATVFFLMHKYPKLEKHVTTIALVVLVPPLVNALTNIYFFENPTQTIVIVLTFVGSGILIMNQIVFRTLLFITCLVWFSIAFHFGFPQTWLPLLFSILAASVIAIIINRVSFKSFSKLHNAKVEAAETNRKLSIAKEKLEKQSEELKSTIVHLEIANSKIEEASAAKENFLSTMSHELRTPLNAVIGLTRILQDNNPREDQLDDLETLQFSADNLLALISDVLDFSKIGAGKVDLESNSFEPKNLLEKLNISFQNKAKEQGVELRFKLGDFPPVSVLGDPTKFTQVINNLLSNAFKFTKEGHVSLSSTVLEKSESSIRISVEVQDSGIGIPEDKLGRIFEAFNQADSNTTRKYGGTGLGLAITKDLVRLLGGELKVKSKENEGSTFYFELDLPLDQNKKTKEKPQPKNLVENISFPEGTKVLVVEDNLINVKVISKLLKARGVQHEIVKDGSSACQIIQNKQYSLVLMDLEMPIMDGYEATMHIRAMDDAYFKNIPIIALSASVLLDVKKDVMEAGMTDYVSKPIDIDELSQKMLKALEATKVS